MFNLKFFSDPKSFSCPKFFWEPKFFQTQKFFRLFIFFRPKMNFMKDDLWREKGFWTWGCLNWQGQRFYFNWSWTLKTKSCFFFNLQLTYLQAIILLIVIQISSVLMHPAGFFKVFKDFEYSLPNNKKVFAIYEIVDTNQLLCFLETSSH